MAMTFGTLDFAVAFNRQTAFPLDAKSYFESLELATAAAASAQEAGSSETTYYFGQTVAVVENGKATLYVIQPDKTLKEVGGNIAINENVFAKDKDGTLNLLGFADAVGGAQLVKTEDGKVSWVKPDTTTVEGLSTAIESLKTTIGDDKSGLVKQVADNKAAIDTLNGDKTITGSVAYQIAQIVAGADESFDTLKEIAEWITTHKTDAATMNAQINTNKDDIASLKTLVGSTAVATQIATAIDTALKDGETDKYALAADLTSLSDEVAAIKTKLGEKSVADQIDAALRVDGVEKYALASHTHEIANVTGLQEILNGKAAAKDVETSMIYPRRHTSMPIRLFLMLLVQRKLPLGTLVRQMLLMLLRLMALLLRLARTNLLIFLLLLLRHLVLLRQMVIQLLLIMVYSVSALSALARFMLKMALSLF